MPPSDAAASAGSALLQGLEVEESSATKILPTWCLYIAEFQEIVVATKTATLAGSKPTENPEHPLDLGLQCSCFDYRLRWLMVPQ